MVSERTRTFNDLMVNLQETNNPRKLVEVMLNKTPILGYHHSSAVIEASKRNEILKLLGDSAVGVYPRNNIIPNVHVLVDIVEGVSILHCFSTELYDGQLVDRFEKKELTFYDIWHIQPEYKAAEVIHWSESQLCEVPIKELDKGIVTEELLQRVRLGYPNILSTYLTQISTDKNSSNYYCFIQHRNELVLIKFNHSVMSRNENSNEVRICSAAAASSESGLTSEERDDIRSFSRELIKQIVDKYPVSKLPEEPEVKPTFIERIVEWWYYR